MANIKLDNIKRNYDLENKALDHFDKVFGTDFPKEEMKQRLIDNGFKGIYIVPDKLYYKYEKDENICGSYYLKEKIIVIPMSLSEDKNVLYHEFTHALIGNRIVKKVKVDNDVSVYGNGFEEGLANILSLDNPIANNMVANDKYTISATSIRQLDYLYTFYKEKKYKSILIEAIKEPEDFIKLVYNIYESIIFEICKKYDFGYKKRQIDFMAHRNALDVITYSDESLENDKYNDYHLLQSLSYINYLYVCLADNEALYKNHSYRLKKIFNDNILNMDVYSREDKLLSVIFDDPSYIISSILSNIEYSNFTVSSYLEEKNKTLEK